MPKSQFRYGKKLVQAWIPEEVLEQIHRVSKSSLSQVLIESLYLYLKNSKSEKELAEERYQKSLLETETAKAELDRINKLEIDNNIKKEELAIKIKKDASSDNLSEREFKERWEIKIWPHIKRKISEVGFEQVIKDERMLDNFSKGLSISTGQLKEKISTEWGVV
ncbi:MAG: hypothetical protein WDA59_08970 [Methanofastidiosum sp.]